MVRILHLHIPKTAGTTIRKSLQAAHPEIAVQQIENIATHQASDSASFVSGHFSYDNAVEWGGDIITVLRHPIDRFISMYFFLKQLHDTDIEISRKTTLASKLSLQEFTRAFDEPELVMEYYNRITWQLHSDFRLHKRFEARRQGSTTEQSVLTKAKENLASFSVVGFQDHYADFISALNKTHNLNLENKKINVTVQRSTLEDLTRRELDGILKWVEMDMELYDWALEQKKNGLWSGH